MVKRWQKRRSVIPTIVVITIATLAALAGVIAIIVGLEWRRERNQPKRISLGLWLAIAGVVFLLGAAIFGFAMLNGR